MTKTRRTFHAELDDLRVELVELGAAVIEAVRTAGKALADGDLVLAQQVVDGDNQINERSRTLDNRNLVLIARYQPAASDLRALFSTARVVQELESSSDLMVNIARITRRLYPHALPDPMRKLVHSMTLQGAAQLVAAIGAFADCDRPRARALEDMDDVMDDLQRNLLLAIFDAGAPDDGDLQRAVEMALVARFFERVADHAVNIAGQVEFLITGELADAPTLGDEDATWI